MKFPSLRTAGEGPHEKQAGDPVVVFFVKSPAKKKKKAYDNALREAEKEQKRVIEKYNKQSGKERQSQ